MKRSRGNRQRKEGREAKNVYEQVAKKITKITSVGMGAAKSIETRYKWLQWRCLNSGT